MTIIFRTSTFFIIGVITLKATTFVVGALSENTLADQFSAQIEQLVDEAVRFRNEVNEASDRVADMASALQLLGNRAINRAQTAMRGMAQVLRRVASQFTLFSQADALSSQNTATQFLYWLSPEKGNDHDKYLAA